MVAVPSVPRDARTLAAVGGILYAVVVLAWLSSAGVYISSEDPSTIAFGVAYAAGGMFLTAAIPLYLLGRFSLVTPVLATLWLLGDTMYQWQYGTHLHPLSSYLIVWPILLGLVVAFAAAEALVRIGADRTVGELGLRPLL